MDQLIEINSLEEYEKAIQTKSIILFTASWCPDCMFIKPFMPSVEATYDAMILWNRPWWNDGSGTRIGNHGNPKLCQL